MRRIRAHLPVLTVVVFTTCALALGGVFLQSSIQAQGEYDVAPTLLGAHDLMRSGAVPDGAYAVLRLLRALPSSPEAFDEAVAPLNLLTFCMCMLMQDDVLLDFMSELDATTYPVDALVLAYFYAAFPGYEPGRNMKFLSQEENEELLVSLKADRDPLVRMGALALEVRKHWELRKPGSREAAVEAVNRMATECAQCRVTRDSFRELLRAALWRAASAAGDTGSDGYQEGIGSFLENPAWNDAMRKIIGEDAIAQALAGVVADSKAAGPKSAQEMLGGILAHSLDLSREDADMEVRAWFATTLGPCLRSGKHYSTFSHQVHETFDALSNEWAERGQTQESEPLDLFRVRYFLFTEAINQSDKREDCRHFRYLLDQPREIESVNFNWYEMVAREVNYYANHLVNEDRYEEAIEVFQYLADTYPKSELARRTQETIKILTDFLHRPQS